MMIRLVNISNSFNSLARTHPLPFSLDDGNIQDLDLSQESLKRFLAA